MKVCIPCTEATGEQACLFIPSSQAPFFALWDEATDQLEFQPNPLAGQDHACACATAHWLQRVEAGVLITADLGRRAAQRLTEAGTKVLQAPVGNLGELLAWYRHGSLVPAPASEPRWLSRRVHHTEYCSQPNAASRHQGGQGRCGGEYEGRHGPKPQRHGGHHHHGGQGQCYGERQGRHIQGHRGRGGHGGGCCRSA